MDDDKRKFLDTVCNQISYKPIQKELIKEIEDHIEDSSMDGVDQGMSINVNSFPSYMFCYFVIICFT